MTSSQPLADTSGADQSVTGAFSSATSNVTEGRSVVRGAADAMSPATRVGEGVTSLGREVTGIVHDAGAVLGTATSAVTMTLLSAVPAMLLLFPSPKVPVPIPIPIMFKPEKLAFKKEAHWKGPFISDFKDPSSDESKVPLPLHEVPEVEYSGGGPEELTLDLFFDTTDTQLDVRLHTKPIQMLVYRMPIANQPPLVMFSWGMMLSKMSYVNEVSIDYTMFRPDGTPLRADVQLKLVEYDMGWLSMLPLNPTSYTEARKTWVVIEGETLDWIAYQEYGDSAQWRHIARVNNLDNPRDLRSGQILKLTPLD